MIETITKLITECVKQGKEISHIYLPYDWFYEFFEELKKNYPLRYDRATKDGEPQITFPREFYYSCTGAMNVVVRYTERELKIVFY